MTQSFQSNSRANTDRLTESQRLRDSDSDVERNRDDDTTFDDPRIASERAEERRRAEARDDARERAERATPNVEHRATGLGTSYLAENKTEDSWEQWRKIQADFVDNPRDAVSNAHGLVGDLIDNIVRQFETEKDQMEQRWSSGEDVSTEDLRKCLQTYRDFFGRLLAKVDAQN